MAIEEPRRILFVEKQHCTLLPERRVVVPIIDDLSIAMAVDTEEEARALTAPLDRGRRRPPA